METPIEAVNAQISGKKVYVTLSEAIKDLRERGFGTVKKDRLFFAASETLYLADKGRIRVIDSKQKILSLQDLVLKLGADKSESWIKYLIYRDLRERGYIVRDSKRFDFEVYGKGVLRRFLSIIYEGRDASLATLGDLLKYSQKEKKELVLAVIDRRTDIVYYTLESLVI